MKCVNCRHTQDRHTWTALNSTPLPKNAVVTATTGIRVEYVWRCVAPCTCQQWEQP